MYRFHNLEELCQAAAELGLDLPVAEQCQSVLSRNVRIGGAVLHNALAVHPMEGCDGAEDGSPDELVFRRYERFAQGGAALIWMEACAVCPEGRANSRQLYLNPENKEMFKALVDRIRFKAEKPVYLVLQLTHSGRYAKPYQGAPAVIAAANRYLDPFLPENYRMISDEELYRLQDQYVQSAKLAEYAGFDAVDIKACHRYLNNELLSAYTRQGSFGGSFENRTRFLFETVDKVREGTTLDLAVRINAFDEIPYPYGFGVDRENFRKPDLMEIEKIAKLLQGKGVRLLNITGGNPYYNPHVNRPYDHGPYQAPGHPLGQVYKLLNAARSVKQAAPGVTVLATGFTWLQEWGGNVAAGCIAEGWCDLAGFGRQAFAYPDFAKDLMQAGTLERRKCCITCSKCTEIMRCGGRTGCVVRDSEIYLPVYRECVANQLGQTKKKMAEHL